MNAPARDPVAIVGIGCRFPGGVSDAASFWQLLDEGRDAIAEIPADRIDLAHFYDTRPATPGRMMTRWGGFLQGIDAFDAEFFGVSPREAERLDPQQRLLLETAWEALEDAGIDTAGLDGSRTGVYVGQWLSDFESRLFADPENVDFQMTTGSGRYTSSGRLSYLLGLRGPSLTLDTACSSSLVAVHLAVRSLLDGESELAIAGGVNVILQPHISIAYSQSRMMAPDGRCKFGDAQGDGYVRSEGAGLVVLKRLSRALADGDRVYAVIRGSAVNNDGRSSGSMGTPSRTGQEELLRSAYRDAGVAPAQVGYVEAHGTGTRAGDPVELGALAAVLGEERDPAQRAAVGSVKTNFGHTEGAAGVAGLIKATLALHRGRIPASLHCREPNPAIPWADMPLAIAREAMPWPVVPGERVAGVSAFGIAGTNAHVVLQDLPSAVAAAETVPDSAGGRPCVVLPLSARSADALRALAGRYADRLERAADAELNDICWSAATRRTALETRAVFVAESREALADALRRHQAGEAAAAEGVAYAGGRPKIAFICPGQGAQWPGMARDLMEREPVFRAALLRCDAAARPYADWSIVEQLAAEPGSPVYRMDRIEVIQPVLVAITLAYAALWREWGVVADAVVGHSMGEVAAACIAGALDLDQAMRIICRRSALMGRTSGQGAMALVDLSMAEAQARLSGREHDVSVAVSNSPRSSVISGRPDAVNALLAELATENIFCRLVKVDVASHSPQMQPLATELATELAELVPRTCAVSLYSTVLGRQAQGAELGAGYWADNLRQPVRFGATVQQMLGDGISVFIELGPHPVLLPSVEQTAQAARMDAVSVACARRGEPEQPGMLAAAGSLHCAGVPLDWLRVMPAAGRFADLPAYPWQRERHWISAAERGTGAQGHGRVVDGLHPVLGHGVELAGSPRGALWTLSLEPKRMPAWFEHALHGSTLLPASAFLELALAAARSLGGGDGLAVLELSFERALHLQADATCNLQLQAVPDGQRRLRLSFQTHSGSEWLRHAQAVLGPVPVDVAPPADGTVRARLSSQMALTGAVVYERFQSIGVHFGAALRRLDSVWLTPDEALARITPEPQDEAARDRFCVAPPVLDACIQLMVLLAPADGLYLPAALAGAHRLRTPQGELWVHARARAKPADGASRVIDAVLTDAGGPVLVLKGLSLQRLDSSAATDRSPPFFELQWVPVAVAEQPPQELARTWLLLADAGGMAEALERQLGDAGDAVQVLKDPTTLPVALGRTGAGRLEVVDLRPLDLGLVDERLDPALHGLLLTARTLGALPPRHPARLWWVTRAAQCTKAGEAAFLTLAQAPVHGLAGVLATEQGERWGGCIDLDPARATAAGLAESLSLAVRADAGSVAVRDGQLLQARLRPTDAGVAPGPVWRPDTSYLLSGGLGGVGEHVARWLVQAGVRHLVLMSRTPLPARAQWSGLDPASAAGRAVAAVRALEALGADVHHAAVDVGDEAALGRWLAQFQAEGRPPIRGVLHLAGITDDRLVADVDTASLRAVLRPKLHGAWNLHRLLPDLDAFILFSSMAALLPQAGQASYAAANAFLDVLARQRRALGQHALSVGWGVWTQTGVMQGEVGQRQLDELVRQGIGGIPPARALALLDEVLRLRLAHVLVLPLDRARLRANLAGRRPGLLQDLLAQAAPGPDGAGATVAAGPELPTDPGERRRALERAVREAVGRVLKLVPGRIDARKPLGSMGLTSLMALELRNRLEPLHGKPLSATLAWNYPTVEALVDFLGGTDTAAPVAPHVDGPSLRADVVVALDDVNDLSDEDAARLLRKRR